MKNCLATKLRAIVNDNSLPRVNGFRFDVIDGITGENAYKFTTDGEVIVPVEFPVVTQSGSTYELSKGTYKFNVVDKYSLKILRIANAGYSTGISMSLDSLKFTRNITQLSITNAPAGFGGGDISSISENTKMNDCEIYKVNATGDITAFSNLIFLNRLVIRDNPSINGNIASLAKLINLSSLYINNTGCSGTLESLGEGMVSNGRTSGTLTISCNNIVTHNGIAVTGLKYIDFTSSGYTIR